MIIILTVLNSIYTILHTLHPAMSGLPIVSINFTTVRLASVFEHNVDILNFQPNQTKNFVLLLTVVGYIYRDYSV